VVYNNYCRQLGVSPLNTMYFVGRTFCDDREYEVRCWTVDVYCRTVYETL